MDPNATLAEIRTLCQQIENMIRSRERSMLAGELIERIEALDEWISRGGFLPSAWVR